MKNLLSLMVLISVMASSAAPVVSDLVTRQMWPWDGKVRVSFVLSGLDADSDVKINLAASLDGMDVRIPFTAVSGDLYADEGGAKTLFIDTAKVPELASANTDDFSVSVSAENCGKILYKLVDLTKDPGAEGQVTYISEEQIRSGAFGAYETDPISGVASVVWTEPAKSYTTYADKYLVLRRIRRATFMYGKKSEVTLSPYWISVFLTTRAQFARFTGNEQGYVYYPRKDQNYVSLRGVVTIGGVDCVWPESGHRVSDSSVVGKLRSATGIQGFDLATDAQWEYACRAGTDTAYYYNSNSDAQLSDYCAYNATSVQVATKKPNAWGLYDMSGCCWEWVLDWNPGEAYQSGLDPVGPATSGASMHRLKRGGGYNSGSANCTSFKRLADDNCKPDTANTETCAFRFVINGQF